MHAAADAAAHGAVHAAAHATVIVIVAGVSGSGKSTVGQALAVRLGWAFTDGDSMHPASNIAKMADGTPLNDQDRVPWLRAIAAWMDEQIAAGRPAVIVCSALKRRYRDLLVDRRSGVRVVFLQIDRDLSADRLAARHGHFFDPALLDSQFADLEPPVPAETAVVPVRVLGTPDDIVSEIIGCLGLAGPP